MDKEAPSDSVLKSQLTQDSSVSVLQNGEWGSYQCVSEHQSKLGKFREWAKNLPEDIQMESVYLQYLCYDKEAEQSRDNKVRNYGIEYSGVQDTGGRVMGLSLVNSLDPISKPDPILQWTLPNDWSLEDAVTVPFIYTQAYYILDAPVIQGEQYRSSILINVGDEGPFCQACISISLSRKHTVYVTVSSNEEAVLIKKKFPEIDERRIFNLKKCSLQAEIFKMTNNVGVSLVINCLPGMENIRESLNCIRSLGYFIQIGQTNGWESQQLDLYPFLKSLSFRMVPNRISKLLVDLSVDEKQNLKAVVDNGIKSGVVVPIESDVQIQGMSGVNNELLKNNHIKQIFKWSPNTESCHTMNQKIRFDDKHSYIIIGGEKKNHSWFELLQWLMSKGARKFIATVDNFFVGPRISHRINRLLNQKKATIILSSSQKTESLQEAETLVRDANKIAPLEAVFFASIESIGINVQNMDLVTRKLDPNIHLVSIFSGGLKELESRRFAGSPAVVFHGNRSSCKLSTVLPLIDNALSQFDNSYSPTLYRLKNTESKTVKSVLRNYLPRDTSFFEKIADDLSDKLEFVEVTTKTPRYSDLKDSFPIFIISTLGAKPLEGLISNLTSPAFCCSIGTSECPRESALKLYESLNRIQSKAGVTLLSETWSTPIAFELTKLLDKYGRKYRLFTLEGNCMTWKDRIRSLGPTNSNQFENNLIAELFNISSEIRLDTLLGVNKPLAQKISDYMCSQNYPSINILNILKILHSVQLGLDMISKYEYNDQLIKNTICLLQNPNEREVLRMSVTSEVFVHEEDDYQKFLSSYEVSKKINNDILHTVWYD